MIISWLADTRRMENMLLVKKLLERSLALARILTEEVKLQKFYLLDCSGTFDGSRDQKNKVWAGSMDSYGTRWRS
ncbi:hypothetical protein CEXT_270821 [Caerostris extrusa]|uniref:Uncharacterized protein n=1 Tax=Caerostris extrusa TaxID=172846 RepID=A0AAV4M7J2_CAEEX|nr:hypothetical protein CEXT_270821 [Caerostris extrusa]